MSETIIKTRRLPTKGEVYVSQGQVVQPDTVIAGGTVLNPELVELKLSSLLRVDPDYVKNYLTKSEGDHVSRDEVIGVSRSFFTRQTRTARSPIDGKIEAFSMSTGRMMIRGNPIKMEVSAHIARIALARATPMGVCGSGDLSPSCLGSPRHSRSHSTVIWSLPGAFPLAILRMTVSISSQLMGSSMRGSGVSRLFTTNCSHQCGSRLCPVSSRASVP